MKSPQFFHRQYKDPVVEYYFLPANKEVRLTKRFGKVFVHRRLFDAGSSNKMWLQEPAIFADLVTAEQYALSLLSSATTIRYDAPIATTNRVCELTTQYRVA